MGTMVAEKEKSDKSLVVMVRPSFYNSFDKCCDDEGRTVSEVVRELMSKYIKGWNQVPPNAKVAK